MKLALLFAFLLASCYRPNGEVSCGLTCDPMLGDSDCPSELACNADGRCSIAGAACTGDSGVDTDASPDAPMPPDVPANALCLGTPPMNICFNPGDEPTVPITLGDFNTSTMCTRNELHDGQDVCILAGTTISVGARRRISGGRPLVLVATQTLTIEPAGVIDLSSSSLVAQPRIGAGAQPAQCTGSSTGPTHRTARLVARSRARAAKGRWALTELGWRPVRRGPADLVPRRL